MLSRQALIRGVAGLALLATSLAPAAAARAAEGGSAHLAAAAPPTLTSPADRATLTTFGPTLTWTNPANATQVHVQVIPANNDGPGVNLYFGSAVSSLQIPPPPEWYGLLPGMSYTWRVRVSDATTGVGLEDASWSTVAERKFKTPSVDSSVISLKSPNNGNFTLSRTPTFQWESSRKDVFYWEVQVSKDQTFELDPAKATAMVYSVLLHGGVTTPANSYTIPAGFPLEEGTVYYWRARPRVQGDGTPVAWSKAALFRVVAPGFRAAVTLGNGPAGALEVGTVGADGALRSATIGESPYWAPGGKRMILVSGEATGGNPEIYVANADGSGKVRISQGGMDPTWSPDGQWVTYAVDNDIFAARPDGSGRRNLTSAVTPQAAGANWAPDSSKLTFYTVDTTSGDELTDIWVVNADGTGARNLTSTPAVNESFPSFSPDGERIAYFQGGRGNSSQELWVMNADGSNKKRLASNVVAYGPAQWSPDAGTRILFTVAGSGTRQTAVINSDGTGQKQLTQGDEANGGGDHAAWSTDAAKITFTSHFEFGPPEPMLANADGTGAVRVARGRAVPTHNGPRPWPVWPTH